MKFQKILFIILVLLGSAFGGITVTATKNNHTDKAGYFNNANVLSITLTQDGGDIDQSQVNRYERNSYSSWYCNNKRFRK